MAEDLAAFGRKVAAAQGYSTSGDIDWRAYGEAARNAMGRDRAVPDPSAFGAARPSRPNAAPPASVRGPGLRVGRYEVRRIEEPEPRNRPHHLHHKGQRSSAGRYRTREFLRRITRRRRGSAR